MAKLVKAGDISRKGCNLINDKMTYPFKITVHVYRRPHMRDDNLEYELYMGQNVLRQIFDEERVDNTVKSLFLSFPERWLNIVEERSLYDRLKKYCPELKELFIKTQSVYIIQCTSNGSVFIVQSEAEIAGAKLPQESVDGKLYFPNANNIHNGGLTIL